MPLYTVSGRLCGEILDRVGHKIVTGAATTNDGFGVDFVS